MLLNVRRWRYVPNKLHQMAVFRQCLLNQWASTMLVFAAGWWTGRWQIRHERCESLQFPAKMNARILNAAFKECPPA